MDEGATTNSGLGKYNGGRPNNAVDGVSFVAEPSVNWITLVDPATAGPMLRIVAPQCRLR